jgi:hypothetical protein
VDDNPKDNQFPRCAKCNADRGGVIDIASDGNKAKLLCFQCKPKPQA